MLGDQTAERKTRANETQTSGPTILRRVMAFAAAPAGGMVVAAFCFQAINAAMDIGFAADRPPPESLSQAISDLLLGYCFILYGVVLVGALPAYVVTVVVGVPLHVWLETRGWRTLYTYLALGAGLSLLALLVGHLQTSLLDIAESVVPPTLIGGLAGGVIFRRICFRRRSNRHPVPMPASEPQ